jgi:hypothetical protein
MSQSFAVEMLPYVLKALNTLGFLAEIALWIAVIFLPRTQSGFWSWNPLKRLLAAIFLPPVILLGIFLWPLVLIGWLSRPRCNCCNCSQDDD